MASTKSAQRGEPSQIFRRTSTDGPDKARVCGTRDDVIDLLNLDHMMPVVSKVIDVMDGLVFPAL